MEEIEEEDLNEEINNNDSGSDNSVDQSPNIVNDQKIDEDFYKKAENNKTNLINMTRLLPEDLLIVEVYIKDRKLNALIDSGATNNLVKGSLVNSIGLKPNSSKTTAIKGLGNSEFRTFGTIDLEIDMLGVMYTQSGFDIVPDNTSEFDIILGVTFLREKVLIINMNRRKFSLVGNNGSSIDFYIRKDNTLVSVIHEEIPVYVAADIH